MAYPELLYNLTSLKILLIIFVFISEMFVFGAGRYGMPSKLFSPWNRRGHHAPPKGSLGVV